MAVTLYIVFMLILAVWLVFFYFLKRWPLKVVEHNVFCPVQKKPARISLMHSQVSIGSYMPSDISSCSLFPQGPVSCGRQCLK